MGEVSKVTGALKAKPLYHSSPAPDQEGYLPAPSPISLLRREPCRGCRPHRDIPSVCRQLTLFRCPGISSQPSTSHSPSTSSSQQILKPEKRRKWRPYVSRLSVSATGQPAQSGTWKLPPPPTWKNQAGKPWNRRSEGKGLCLSLHHPRLPMTHAGWPSLFSSYWFLVLGNWRLFTKHSLLKNW